MGLRNNTDRLTFVNISKGRLYTKKKDENPIYFTDLDGTITGVSFENKEFKGDRYEVANIQMADDAGERFQLQMRVDSGYFRNFCNALKSGDPTDKITVVPSYKEVDGKPQSTIFVRQYGKPLKHAHTKDNMGNYPELKSVTFKGKKQYDGTEQIEFWKKWLLSLKFNHPVMAEAATPLMTEPEVDDINSNDQDDLPF